MQASKPGRAVAIQCAVTKASKQYGLITFQQALESGLSRHAIQHLVKSKQWKRVRQRVFAVGGVPGSWHQSLMAACLAGAGYACGTTAGYLYGFDGVVQPRRLEIVIPRSRNVSLKGVAVSRVDWGQKWLTKHRRIPTTDPTLTLLALGATLSIERLELALEDVLRRSATSFKRLRELLDGEGKGKTGSRSLRLLLDERDPDVKATDSWLETRIWQLFRKYRLPLPERQYEVLDDGEFVARPDFAYPREKVAIEGISWRYHSGMAALEHDRNRRRALESAGWIVIDVTNSDLRQRPLEVVKEIKSALQSRGRIL
jgi:very-short-patch-repair endonuclease